MFEFQIPKHPSNFKRNRDDDGQMLRLRIKFIIFKVLFYPFNSYPMNVLF